MCKNSHLYQSWFYEIPTDPNALDWNPAIEQEQNDEIQEVKEQIIERLLYIIDTHLTERQRSIIHMRLEGLTQYEIADKLNTTQSAINKSINGNILYPSKQRQGGIITRIHRVICEDKVMLDLVIRWDDLRNGGRESD